MNRSIIYDQEQVREFDILWGWRDAMIALGFLEQDIAGATTTVVGGFVATQTASPSLSINLAAGRIYELAQVDTTTYGSLAADTDTIMQQGLALAQQVTLSTGGLSAGQSQWALIQAQFSQADVIRAGDPTGGVLYYWNSSNPTQPFQGPGNSGATNNTEREGVMTISVVLGAAATTGSEVPPNATSGWVGLYLVDLAFGQTTITTGQVLVAGPSVGTGVPSNYPRAPFLAGLLNQHHKGTAGQAPQIDLTAEVKNILPMANLPASNTAGGLSSFRQGSGSPQGVLAGNAATNGAADTYWDNVGKVLYICTTTGTSGSAVWSTASVVPVENLRYITASTTVIVNASTDQVFVFNRTVSPAAMAIDLPATAGLTNGQKFTYIDIAGNFNAAPITLTANSGQTFPGGGTTRVYNVDFGTVVVRWVASASKWTVEP